MEASEASFDQFSALDIRAGTVIEAAEFSKARKPALKMKIDFGPQIGVLKSSAQIVELYSPEALIGTQVLAIVNFPKKQIADFMSECLVLGLYTDEGVVLLRPDKPTENGGKVG